MPTTERPVRAWLSDAAGGFLIVLVAAGLVSGILLWRLQDTVAIATQGQSRELAASVGRSLGRQFVRAGQLGIPLDAIPAITRSLDGTLAHVPQLTAITLTDADGRVLGAVRRPGVGAPTSVSTVLTVGEQRIGTLEIEAVPPALRGSHAILLTGLWPLVLPLALLGGLCTALHGAHLRRHRRRLDALLNTPPDDLMPPVPGPRPDSGDILGRTWHSLQTMAARTAQRRADLAHQAEALRVVDFDGGLGPRLAALGISLAEPEPQTRIVPPDRGRRLPLRLRLTLAIALGFALLIGSLSGLQALREHLLRQQSANLSQEDQRALWKQFLASQTLHIAGELRDVATRLEASGVDRAFSDGGRTTLDRLALIDPNRQVHPLQGDAADDALLDAGTLDEVLAGRTAQGLRTLDDDHTVLVAARPVRLQGGTWALVGARGLDAALQQVDPDGLDEQYSVHFLNPKGRLVASTGRALWARLGQAPSVRDAQSGLLEEGDRILLRTATPVASLSGGAGGLLVTLKDVTTLMKPSLTLGGLALLLAAGLAVLGLALIYRIIWRSFRPLQDALQTLDELSGPQDEARGRAEGRRGEIEQLGRSIAALHHKTLQLASDQLVQTRVRRRLVEQHRQLSDMVIELRDALVTKTKLAGLQQELQIASAVQLSILPRTMPDDPRMELGCRILPARDVGGDFYDFYMLDEHHLGFVIADVSGKGIPAALFMAISRTLLKSTARFVRQPADCIRRLNDLLAAENEQMLFVTLFYATLDLRDGRLDYVNAGHHAPWLKSVEGELSTVPLTRGIAVGVAEDMPYVQKTLYLRPGDLLYLYTDGITEAFDPDGRVFGDERLEGLLRVQPADVALDVLTDAVIADVRAFENGTDPTDDVTSLCLRYYG